MKAPRELLGSWRKSILMEPNWNSRDITLDLVKDQAYYKSGIISLEYDVNPIFPQFKSIPLFQPPGLLAALAQPSAPT
jgi:hypothetical protein